MKAIVIAAAVFATASTGQAATIYLCKAYNGATFWAKAHCNQHNALIERIENVADVPWEQQVQQAEQAKAARSQQSQSVNAEASREARCAQLTAERNTIESRYTNWQWQPPEVINPDQQRMRALRGELAANRCATQ